MQLVGGETGFASQSGRACFEGGSMTLRLILLAAAAGILLAGCSKKDEAAEKRAAEAAVAEQLPSGPASLPTSDTVPGEAATLPSSEGGPPTLATVAADFDPGSVPETTASLPPFPFFKDPEGLENELKGNDALKPFDRH